MSAIRSNRVTHREARSGTNPLRRDGRFPRRGHTQLPIEGPFGHPLERHLLPSNTRLLARPALEADWDPDEEIEERQEMEDGDVEEDEFDENHEAESVPETDCTYASSEEREDEDEASEDGGQSAEDVEYDVDEAPVTIDMEIPWDHQPSTSNMPQRTRPVASNWRLERTLVGSSLVGNSSMVGLTDPIDMLLESVDNESPYESLHLGIMRGATASTSDLASVAGLFGSRDETGVSLMLGDAVAFLGNDLPRHLRDYDD
ncbi:hypothetical protein FRC17_002961 [Serendipita sp. 399]|nr:hypothetical protein FRC17_002961 [Serendipita sp. 399]